MSDFIEYLKKFNSKERFFLAGEILGNPEFTLAEGFREKLSKKLQIAIPADAFSAMDYHIDWLYASLYLASSGVINKPYYNKEGMVEGHQEDIDWLIAFSSEDEHHIILIEAKGVTGWTNKQMRSKVKRFEEIFGKEGNNFPNVTPHFVTMSPSKLSSKLESNKWLEWMKPPIWLELPIHNKLSCVQRCGEKDEKGKYSHWQVVSR